jgi:oxygen-independent coproporphyrinogen-3 oxidase
MGDEQRRTSLSLEQAAGGAGGVGGAGTAGDVSPAPSARMALEEDGGRREAVRSLYIHTPFCVHKCHYCDFYSFVDKKDQQAAFVDRLIDELRALSVHAYDERGTPVPLATVFVGGGTPSLLRVDLWERLLRAMGELFDLSAIRAAAGDVGSGGSGGGRGGGAGAETLLRDCAPGAEFTVECNPESTTPELLAMLRAHGVGRISVGAQSFDARHLKTLERWHDPANVERAIELARSAGIHRQSVDLIYGVPGQTTQEWARDLERALALKTTHLSCYNLTYEATTAMTARLNAGEFVAVDEDIEADMFELTGTMLGAAGLRRYEVSNYAMPGHESRHNLAYWWQEQWLAAGPSASGHVFGRGADVVNAAEMMGSMRGGEGAVQDRPGGAAAFARAGHRWKNRPALGQYLEFSDAGYAPITGYEAPDVLRAVRERLMTGIRLCDGVDVESAAGVSSVGRASADGVRALWRAVEELAGDGLVELRAGRVRVTDRGWLMADFVAKRLMDGVR